MGNKGFKIKYIYIGAAMKNRLNDVLQTLDEQASKLSRIGLEMGAMYEILLCAEGGEPLPTEALGGLAHIFENYAARIGRTRSALNSAFQHLCEANR